MISNHLNRATETGQDPLHDTIVRPRVFGKCDGYAKPEGLTPPKTMAASEQRIQGGIQGKPGESWFLQEDPGE